MFEILVKSMEGAPSTFGVSVEENMIKYTNRNRILRDFSKFSGLPKSEVAGKLNKTFGGNCKGFKKHFVLAYNRKRKQVTLACNYGCWNEFGYSSHG